jgi:hypothetical protein
MAETGLAFSQIDDWFKGGRQKRRKIATEWYVQYNNLVNYKQKWGHCIVPENYKENPALAKWVNEQSFRSSLERCQLNE